MKACCNRHAKNHSGGLFCISFLSSTIFEVILVTQSINYKAIAQNSVPAMAHASLRQHGERIGAREAAKGAAFAASSGKG
jgi:hypothetical protein